MKFKSQIESLLFISHKPLGIKELAKLTDSKLENVKSEINKLKKEYEDQAGGIIILKIDKKYQMATAGENKQIVDKFVKKELTGELTRPSLETLTIVAYRGPISKAELELIRGVNCTLILRNLLMRGLVEAKESKKEGVTYYNITFDFLRHLGLSDVSELPDYEKLNKNNNLDKLLE